MRKFKHLTLQERERIAIWRSRGLSLRDIGAKLGRNASTLSRELKRNRRANGYWPHKAQESAKNRERQTHKRLRLKSRTVQYEVEQMILKGWSPELAAGRLKLEHPELPGTSHEAIYQWIYAERPVLVQSLIRANPKRKKRWKASKKKSRIPDRVSIQKRPEYVNKRKQAGHWETDLLVGTGTEVLQVNVERKMRLSRLKKLPNKTAEEARKALTGTMKVLPHQLRRSITYDNGTENVEHNKINTALGMRSWFCDPYHSWEKGQVENTNGLIRRFIPKRTRLETIPEDRIQYIEDWLNNRPRKVLNFKTPNEVFNASVAFAP